MIDRVPFTSLLSDIVDNRGRTCPTSDTGIALIATNCVKNAYLYPVFEKVRHVGLETYKSWFRGHPVPGDLIFVCKGSPGQVCLAPDPLNFCIAQDMVALRADAKKVYPLYLFAALRSTEVQRDIENMHVGTLIPHFKKGDFSKLSIPLPSPERQKFIGDWHFGIENKIELNRRMNETLEGMAQAIFKDWFVDFGPTRRKLAGISDPVEIMGGLTPDAARAAELAALFPGALGDDGLPVGWKYLELQDRFEVKIGRTPPRKRPIQKFTCRLSILRCVA
jgi:type I restriction enzyme S subunit